VIIEEFAHIGYGADYSPNPQGDLVSGISLVGKNATVKRGVKVGRNCIVVGDVRADDFPNDVVPSGTTIGRMVGR